MLFEFEDSFQKVVEITEATEKIAGNTGVDDIDLGDLQVEASELASACFINNRVVTPGRLIAQKDAYDFISAYSRLVDVFGADRAAYYAQAASECQVKRGELDYLRATLIGVQQFGGGE